MKLAGYSWLLMDGAPLNGNPDHDAALVKSWDRFGLLILSLPSLVRNPHILPLIYKHCPNSTVLGYIDLMTSLPWLAGAAGEAAMQREPDAMTTKQRRIGQGYDAIVGDYLDITVPGVPKALMEMVVQAQLRIGRIGLFLDSFFATCPFPADSVKHAQWFAAASLMAGWARSLCPQSTWLVTNPSWYHVGSLRFSERWPDLEGVDPIASFMAGPSKHDGGIIFAGFDPVLPWPDVDEQERRIRYAAGCALILDAYLCVGPSDLDWRRSGEYWSWDFPAMRWDIGRPAGGPASLGGGSWARVYERGVVHVNTQTQTAEIVP